MNLADHYIAALHVDTTGLLVGYQIDETGFDHVLVAFIQAVHTQFAEFVADSCILCRERVLTADNDIIFGGNGILHLAGLSIEHLAVERR